MDTLVRHRTLALRSLRPLEDVDETEVRAILGALDRFDARARRLPPRIPKGFEGGGRFRSINDTIFKALAAWAKGEGPDNPFDDPDVKSLNLTREHYRKAAKARGITLRRGATEDEIKAALLDDMRAKGRPAKTADAPKKAPAKTAPAKKAAPGTAQDPAMKTRRKAVRDQHAKLQEALKTANAIADVDEVLGYEGSDDTLRHRVDALTRIYGSPESLRTELLDAIPDRDKVREVLDRHAAKAGISPIGAAGEPGRFTPTLHQSADGSPIRPGAPVQVVRRGFRHTADGDDTRLTKALVEEISEDEYAELTRQPDQDPTQARADLRERLANLGRREPKDSGPLDRAAQSLANGVDRKDVAKQLRADAEGLGKEDGDTLRLLAADLTKKPPKVEPYIDENGNLDLVKLAELNGIDIKKWMPAGDRLPTAMHGTSLYEYHVRHPFDRNFRYWVDTFAQGKDPKDPHKKRIARMRSSAAMIRQHYKDAIARRGDGGVGRGIWTNASRSERERQIYVEKALKAADDLDKLADLAERAKIPPKPRFASLGGTTLGEVVQVDESRFAEKPLREVLRHRGEAIPDDLRHGSGPAIEVVRKGQRRPGLTDAENRALDLYTMSAVADRLNTSLRRGRNAHGTVDLGAGVGTVDLNEVQFDLDSAIANSELTEDTVLWRGALVAQSDLNRLVPGAVYHEAGYLSTSTGGQRGAQWALRWRMKNGTVPKSRKPVLFRILAPAGTNAALGHERVNEAVLPRNQELRVVRVDDSGEIPVIVMEALPRPKAIGITQGRKIVDEMDYEQILSRSARARAERLPGDPWLASILRAQGFDGLPRVVTKERLDEIVASGEAIEMWRGISGPQSGTLAEQFRSGELFPGTGIYGNGIYASTAQRTAEGYAGGNRAGVIRMALRREARVISYEQLAKLRSQVGLTKAAEEINRREQAELDKLDPGDLKAIIAVKDKYADMRRRQSARSRVISDRGRLAALFGYDAIVKKDVVAGEDYYVILNRTAVVVQEAS